MKDEQFTEEQIIIALKEFINYGEESYVPSDEPKNKGHRGYFSGGGWAARCLRYHLKSLKDSNA